MSYHNLTIGQNFPEIVNAVIEIPKGSRNKYEYDEALDLIRLDRVLHSSVFYPADYGFIPETRAEDGDHVDVLTLITEPVFPGCVVAVRPIGIADMTDDKGKDWKILAVANDDPRFAGVCDLADVEGHLLKEVQNFFEVYKQLEQKTVTFAGWLSKAKTLEIIRSSHEMYHKL